MSNLYLEHHGIKGMKWGIRRYQNEDGSLTDAGYRKYYNSKGKITLAGRKARKKAEKLQNVGQSSVALAGVGAAINYSQTHKRYAAGRKFLKEQAPRSLYNLSLKQVPSSSINAMSATFVAGIAALTVAEISPYAKYAYQKGRYVKDSKYKTMTDSRANLKDTVRAQKYATSRRLGKKSNTTTLTTPNRPKLKANDSDSAVTKRVKNDYNTLGDKEFKAKYRVTKDVYAKRVAKYGDPYKHVKNDPTSQAIIRMGNRIRKATGKRG